MKSKSFFYPKLALSNMKKNAGIYLPYLLAGSLLSGLFFIILAVGNMAVDSGMYGAQEMKTILDMCAVLCIVFMFLILFYINSFVMKRRKKELGLYCILGMEKRHLCLLLFWEVLLSALVSIAGGLLFGALFSQFMFLVLLKLIQIPAKLVFAVPFGAAGMTAVIFLAGYLATLLYDWIVIAKTNPIQLLKSRQEGEREPKTKWLTALVGAAALAGGYGLALRTVTASEGLFTFFPAALLVIIATYCLFQAGSIVLLKALRKKKSFYYRPENFISVSGMIYRMKQNAAGLATIAILSTALLVVLSSSVSLYSGEEGKLMDLFPREYRILAQPESLRTEGMVWDTDCGGKVKEILEQAGEETGVRVKNGYDLYCAWWMGRKQENHFGQNISAESGTGAQEKVFLTLVTAEDYNEMTGGSEILAEDEILYVAPQKEKHTVIFINGKEFTVKKQVPRPEGMPHVVLNQEMFSMYMAVVSDMDTLLSVCRADAAAQSVEYYCFFDLEGEAGAVAAFTEAVPNRIPAEGTIRFESRSGYREQFYMLYGSILFIGILFACLFLLATVLIVYYKQVTEGYDDRERFQIMEKVGMRDTEIRSAIQKQVMIVFFLPLVTAVLHIGVAATVLRLFLSILGLTDQKLFWSCIAISCAVFSAVYFIVYRLTSRVYYRIVHGK